MEQGQKLVLVDATWFMPGSSQTGAAEHSMRRITDDTRFFDHEAVAEPGAPLAHTMPSLDVFIEKMKAVDIQRTHSIVCYDQSPMGVFSSPRAAWMLRFFGATDVRVLNGGMKKWLAESLPVISLPQEAHRIYCKIFEQADGDYDYTVKDPSRVITDIGIMHDLAGKLYEADGPGALDF